jgi:hypothetical protein
MIKSVGAVTTTRIAGQSQLRVSSSSINDTTIWLIASRAGAESSAKGLSQFHVNPQKSERRNVPERHRRHKSIHETVG